VGGGTTNDAIVDLMIVGELDLKYVALGNKGIENNKILNLFSISKCGHIILSEVENEVVVGPIREFLRPLFLGTVHSTATLTPIPLLTSNALNPSLILSLKYHSTATISEISIIPFEISMEIPLIVLSNGINKSFHTRRGYRIFLYLQGDNEEYVGLGEVYEPVFSVPLTDKGAHIGGEVTYEIMHSELTAIAVHLEGMTISIGENHPSADIVQTVTLIRASSTASPPVFYGFEQCLLHALSKLGGISLVDAIGAYIGKSKRSSHVLINGFATIRDNSKPITLGREGAKQVMKMKVGNPGGSLCVKDALRVNELVLQSGRNDSNWLRLDANQSWSLPQALDFAKALDSASLTAMEYIEEPLITDTIFERRYMMYRNIKDSDRDSNWRFMSIALDETLIQLKEEDCLAVAREISRNTDKKVGQEEPKSLLPCRYILKPSLLGLNSNFYRQQEGLVTLSCTFEGGIGLAFLVLIGSYYGDVYHGIHAKMDMVHSDPTTRDFTLLSIEKNGMEIQVIEAEKLLNDFILKASAEV
jgi:L-alanine-DL-glutamate epimerase-like enolase superfamily enzyme